MMISKSVKQLRELYGYDKNNVEKGDTPISPRLVSEDDLDSLTAGYPRFLRNNLDWAFWGLERVLQRNPHITETWRDLVSMYRAEASPKYDTLVCTTIDGETLEVPALIDRTGFKYREIEPAILNLVQELDAISNFDPSLHMSDVIYREAQRISASGSKVDGDTNSKIVEEIEAKYLSARHGAKGGVKKEIAEKYFVSERHIDNLIKELKKNR